MTGRYRFAASDRVSLHGLMGAFGPDGIFNLWPDYVWDMNQQVMYWIAAAANRPEISEPLSDFIEAHGGGLWMARVCVRVHAYACVCARARVCVCARVRVCDICICVNAS